MKSKSSGWIPVFYMVLVLACIVLMSSCSDETGATKVLTKQGYTNIRTDGHAYFACPKDYGVTTRFYATAPNGQNVKGAVCKGFWLKNSIVSIEE